MIRRTRHERPFVQRRCVGYVAVLRTPKPLVAQNRLSFAASFRSKLVRLIGNIIDSLDVLVA
jgi:hypothetical protein